MKHAELFAQWVHLCVNNDEFVEHWCRLRGVTLLRSPIVEQIDKATGYDDLRNKRIGEMLINDLWMLFQSVPLEGVAA